GRITLVHGGLWPALVRLAEELGGGALTVHRQEHTASGAHRSVETPYPAWGPAGVAAQARKITADEARGQLGAWGEGPPPGGPQRPERRGARRHTSPCHPRNRPLSLSFALARGLYDARAMPFSDRIRRAGPADAPAIAALFRAAYGDSSHPCTEVAEVWRTLLSDDHL